MAHADGKKKAVRTRAALLRWSAPCLAMGLLLLPLLDRPAGVAAGHAPALLDGPGARSGSRVCARTMVGVAHEDDDLLFINPDIQQAIGPRCAFSTVYLTAGDAGRAYAGGDHVQSREEGVRAAYAEMAGLPDRWTRDDLHLGARTIASFTLNGKTGVRLSFLRLPDGNPDGRGYPGYSHQSLLKLFRGEIRTIRPVDRTQSYTERQLVDSLTALARRDGIKRVLTLDYDNTAFGHTYTPGADHSDHAVAGRYFRRAAFGLPEGVQAEVKGYLGYGMSRLPENLDPVRTRQKNAIFQSYRTGEGCESRACPPGHYMSGKYQEWVRREYALKPRAAQPGEIVSAMGLAIPAGRYERCLGAAGGPRRPGAAVEASTFDCDGSASQSWRIHGGTIRSGTSRHCLTADSQRVTLSPCDGRPQQEWRLDKQGRIESGGHCLFQGDLAARNPRLALGPCTPLRPELRWYGADALPGA
ncbi:ricin-type beta-trefoil lectin domain protein [Streptomyces sp. NBC_01237]|uniref:ricin-type beta-trefoil lectin domain protein n=1 Tax=Streptomyces sp. NBC_01237 TaxID=2903790 RepID=UPI002DDB0776|nr:ricin-type beta-trefoil lectin domain protein [Streptomyces sp. NBC_01237]WRZ77705.1 PIG-L family deacetylase [Streptomyces sp. NBC_01237]